MKNWQIIALCLSIIASVAAATFYVKYEQKTLVLSNYGPVDLGKVFSEKVMVDVTVIDNMGDAGGDTELFTESSFYDKTEPVDKALMKMADSYNRNKEEKSRIKYNEISPISDDTFKLYIRTYITYSSSNFMNIPYTFLISEDTHRLLEDVTLKESIDKIIEVNFRNKKEEVSNHLFITDKVAYGLEESVDE